MTTADTGHNETLKCAAAWMSKVVSKPDFVLGTGLDTRIFIVAKRHDVKELFAGKDVLLMTPTVGAYIESLRGCTDDVAGKTDATTTNIDKICAELKRCTAEQTDAYVILLLLDSETMLTMVSKSAIAAISTAPAITVTETTLAQE